MPSRVARSCAACKGGHSRSACARLVLGGAHLVHDVKRVEENEQRDEDQDEDRHSCGNGAVDVYRFTFLQEAGGLEPCHGERRPRPCPRRPKFGRMAVDGNGAER